MKTPADSIPAPTDPLAVLSDFREQLERARARAILDPTDANLKQYLHLNQAAMHRAGDFAQAWQRVVWTSPGLDSRMIHPVNDQAVQVFNDEKLRQVDDFLIRTAKHQGLFFFFKGTCPFCHKFAPILKAFAEAYGFHVVAVSLDGGALPGFPYPRRDLNLSRTLKVESVPAVFLVDPHARAIHPVAFGYVSGTELGRRIYTLINGQPPDPMRQVNMTQNPESNGEMINGYE